MLTFIGLAVAGVSLCISAVTAWLTLLRGGVGCMAQPPTIYFGPDGANETRPKVFVRALLYSTSARGHIVESMFARILRGDSSQSFSVWVCGNGRDNLSRGAGVTVKSDGVALDHHFLLPRDGTPYQFLPGSYSVEVYAVLVGETRSHRLQTIAVTVSDPQAERLRTDKSAGLYFDWSPETRRYHGHIDNARLPEPPLLLALSPGLDDPSSGGMTARHADDMSIKR